MIKAGSRETVVTVAKATEGDQNVQRWGAVHQIKAQSQNEFICNGLRILVALGASG